MKMLIQKISCCLLLVLFSSCWEPASKITDEIEGTYNFEYPRGDYQLLKIYNDSTFVQEFYADKKSFKNKLKPFYTNKGSWSLENEHELQFNSWLEYCYLRDPDSILPHPKQVTMLNIYWNKATRKHNGYITVYDQTGYYFDKLENYKKD